MINDIQLIPSCSFLDHSLKDENLKFRQWGSLQGSKAIILLVHGLGAHSGWFEGAAKELVAKGFLVIAYDQRGFGTRGNLPLRSYTQWVEELVAISQHFRKQLNGLPLYLLGNSMGALVVMAASKNLDVDGIIICSPGFDGHRDAFPLSYKINTIISALFAPERVVMLPYNLERVTRVISVRNWMTEDPHKKLGVPGSMLLELLKLSKSVLASLKEVSVPVLMITAGQEKVVDNVVNVKIFARLVAPAKKHVEMEDAWHDLMFDPLIDEVVAEIDNWHQSLAADQLKSVSVNS